MSRFWVHSALILSWHILFWWPFVITSLYIHHSHTRVQFTLNFPCPWKGCLNITNLKHGSWATPKKNLVMLDYSNWKKWYTGKRTCFINLQIAQLMHLCIVFPVGLMFTIYLDCGQMSLGRVNIGKKSSINQKLIAWDLVRGWKNWPHKARVHIVTQICHNLQLQAGSFMSEFLCRGVPVTGNRLQKQY